MTSQPKTATLSEHVAAIQAAFQAARDDGCLVEWDFSYIDWWGEREVGTIEGHLYRNKRGDDGVMRQIERELFLEGDI